jgi:hypothetical protein
MVALFVLTAILSAWIFAYRTWTAEERRTSLRIGLLKAMETIKKDIRRSSATYMSFYPSGGGPYTAISLPVADTNADGLYPLNAMYEIDWQKTVIYHVWTDGEGNKTLRRTVYDPRDNTMDQSQRYTQLENVVTTGTGDTGSTTDNDFMEDLDTFEIETLPFIFNFYENSVDPVRRGKEVFGWARFSDGDHTVRFEVTGKDDSSTGYKLGIDLLKIEPCGKPRDVEYANSPPAGGGGIGSSGASINRVYGTEWTNNNYLEYAATAEGDYIEFTDYYDLWRDSAFDDASKDNTTVYVDENDYYGKRVKLEMPWDRTEGAEHIAWLAYNETLDTVEAGRDGNVNPVDPSSQPGSGTTIRTVISSENIDEEGDLIRVQLKTYQGGELLASRAYITRQDGGSANPYDGLENLSPPGRAREEDHRHQELFFKDVYDQDYDSDVEEITNTAWIPADSADRTEIWSEWTAFPFVKEISGAPVNYLITLHVPYKQKAGCKYWQGSTAHSYWFDESDLVQPDIKHASGTPLWTGICDINTSNDIFAVAKIDVWSKKGTVESGICDTKKSSVSYTGIRWSEYDPAGTEILLKARSSNNKFMDGATDWSSITGSTTNPHSLSIGNGRYVQFLAELSTDPVWEAPGQTLSYADYVSAQLGLPNAWDFPAYGGIPHITGVYTTWVDDVEIRWPGSDRICVISGYVARKDDYGEAKVMVDGKDLVRVLGVDISVSMQLQDQTIVEEVSTEVEPKNTGK